MRATMMSSSAVMAPRLASAFVRNLYRMLDQEHPSIVVWDTSGEWFWIRDESAFAEHVLPRYFRGSLDAFRVQLLDHGFKRDERTYTIGWMGGSVHAESYEHSSFVRGHPEKLCDVVRVTTTKRRRKKKKAETTTTEPSTVVEQPIEEPAASESVSASASPTPEKRRKITHEDVLRWLPPPIDIQASPRKPPQLSTSTTDSTTNNKSLRTLVNLITEPLAMPEDEKFCVKVPPSQDTRSSGPTKLPSMSSYFDTQQFSDDVIQSMLLLCEPRTLPKQANPTPVETTPDPAFTIPSTRHFANTR
ncbi:hypothetical protein Poli38472_008279 [Pythium oligandrum]|uniref:HSF-type DNA-binding domain-containing protein n=1 Tax=Pythium oligandrum TaxID=41045 RepID=A0A8K1CNH8_PYTOL|nr:hypothetical protein Poli38472_008279 [Pythium oligandrum]|eukprot:TMW65637.1 hypothetical protein Poli38472_008279 [Pythium oligandrum]